MQKNEHSTVLLHEAVAALKIQDSGIYIDGTFGRGGHSQQVLKELGSEGQLWVIDKDPESIQFAQRMQNEDGRLSIYQGSFADIGALAQQHALTGKLQGVLLDLGVSSPQIDDPSRGFSFMKDGPLDMRMDPTTGVSASDWLNHSDQDEIAQFIKQYVEEKLCKRIAH